MRESILSDRQSVGIRRSARRLCKDNRLKRGDLQSRSPDIGNTCWNGDRRDLRIVIIPVTARRTFDLIMIESVIAYRGRSIGHDVRAARRFCNGIVDKLIVMVEDNAVDGVVFGISLRNIDGFQRIARKEHPPVELFRKPDRERHALERQAPCKSILRICSAIRKRRHGIGNNKGFQARLTEGAIVNGRHTIFPVALLKVYRLERRTRDKKFFPWETMERNAKVCC